MTICDVRAKRETRRLQQVPSVVLYPALELGERDQDELPGADDSQVRLHAALEVIDADAQRCSRFPPRERRARNRGQWTSRVGSHLKGGCGEECID
jgi:hypothetical protein